MIDRVAIIGAGITGIRAALDLAEHGVEVCLIEKEPSIGGHVAQLDRIFPTDDSSMCIISPKAEDIARHPNIKLYTMTEVTGISGEAGNFTLNLRERPRYIRAEKCNGCGECTEICPVEVYNKFDAGIGIRKAIYKPHPEAVPDIVIRDSDHCIDCGLCYDICEPEAILSDNEDQIHDFEIEDITSVIVSTGYKAYDPSKEPRYHYLGIPDVITSLEFERMLSPGGPTGGEIRRLSDGKIPKSIVIIQCVGSRNTAIGRNFCSAVCCMYSIKNANRIKERYGDDIDVTILKCETRAYGKGYQEYNKRIKQTHEIHVLRCVPGSIVSGKDNKISIVVERVKKKDKTITPIVTLNPELVVLSIGMSPTDDTKNLADIFGIELSDDSGFFKPKNQVKDHTVTENPGIYIAGCSVSPRDIQDCTNQGKAVAMKAFIDTISRHRCC